MNQILHITKIRSVYVTKNQRRTHLRLINLSKKRSVKATDLQGLITMSEAYLRKKEGFKELGKRISRD